jgi:hypothetical protein
MSFFQLFFQLSFEKFLNGLPWSSMVIYLSPAILCPAVKKQLYYVWLVGPILKRSPLAPKTPVKLPPFSVPWGLSNDMKDVFENFLVLFNIINALFFDSYRK